MTAPRIPSSAAQGQPARPSTPSRSPAEGGGGNPFDIPAPDRADTLRVAGLIAACFAIGIAVNAFGIARSLLEASAP